MPTAANHGQLALRPPSALLSINSNQFSKTTAGAAWRAAWATSTRHVTISVLRGVTSR